MPKNRLMYLGIILIVAGVSLWGGAELSRRTEWMVPYIIQSPSTLALRWRSVGRQFATLEARSC
jgi:hypothetical protein